MASIAKANVPFVQVPNDLLYDKQISFKAKGIWAYMQAKPSDWQFSADRIITETKEARKSILSGIAELIEVGYVTRNRLKDGRVVYTMNTTPIKPKAKVPKRHEAETAPSQNGTDNKERGAQTNKEVIEIKKVTNVTGDTAIGEVAPETYGNSGINEMHEYWEQTTGMAVVANKQKNRYACSNLLKKHGTEDLKRLIQGVALAIQDTYAPRIYDFVSLQAKTNELILWGRKKGESNNAAANF